MRCAVQSCRKGNGNKASDISFFSFPSNEVLAQKWKQFCQRTQDFNIRTSYICMYHFIRDDFENRLKFEMGFSKKLYLKRNVVPTIYGPNLNIPKRCSQREQQASTLLVKQEQLLQEQDVLSITAQDTTPFEDGSWLGCAEMFECKTVFKRPTCCKQRDQQANSHLVKQEELLQEQDEQSITSQDITPFEDGFSLECAEMFDCKRVFKRPLRCRQREQRANIHLVKQKELLQEHDELSITSQDTTPSEDGSSLECAEMFKCKTVFKRLPRCRKRKQRANTHLVKQEETNFKGPPVIEIKDPFEEVMIKEEPSKYLKTELETLRRENLKIREENRTYRRLFAALERDYKKQIAEYSAHLKVLEDRALAAENECRNMANKLKISFEKDRLPT
ncbi:uncharacterized protein LOC129235744 [Anastrepha obliqua]|uniref:uncharacterized protein LOC129235744 n=1 Tax=Anastrepha obliqua TaxID=95512 RepID=UPI00240A1150|nr:uncharacterized protein LOC129235744 [Anastrepha obliqua]